MRQARKVKNALISILEAQSSGFFVTKKSQKQTIGATENAIKPRVTLYYQGGDFPKSSGSYGSDRIQIPTYRCELQVVSASEVDLNTINNPTATIGEISAALSAMSDASDVADDLMDELLIRVYEIIESAINIDLGLSKNEVTDVWIENFQKDNPLPQGEYLILTGNFNITCRVNETVPGETGIPGTDFDNSMNIKDDPNDNFGTSGNLGG